MMKLTSVALFCFTFIMAANAQDFLKFEGPFLKQLNLTQIPKCNLDDCAGDVSKDDCGSICTNDKAEQFGNLMNRVFKRTERPICGVTLGNIPVGDVETPLKINNQECSLKGPLTVQMIRTDAKAEKFVHYYNIKYPSYKQKADWTFDFRGLTVQCPTGSDVGGRVDVTVDISIYQSFWLRPTDPYVELEWRLGSNVVVSVQYPAGDPKGVSKTDLDTAVEKVFKNTEIKLSLLYYFQALSTALLANCIAPNCPKCP